MIKLLNKTIRSYLFYSFIILLVTIPVFYLVVKDVLLHSVDRSLHVQMRDIRSNLSSIQSADELQIWAKMDKDIRIIPASEQTPDQISTVYHPDHRHHDHDPYRELSGNITVNGQLYTLIISNSLVENEDLLGSVVMVEFFLLVLLMGGLLWINRSTAKKIWRPFYSSVESMKKYDLAVDPPLKFEPTEIQEFREMNQAISELTDKSHQAYLRQREFTENAAHEMQTPLAIFQGKIELLMQTEPLTEEQARLISALDETNLRLSRLNKSLLLLSKIENNQFFPTEVVDAPVVLKEMVNQFQGDVDEHHAPISTTFSNDIRLTANKTLIEVLFGNLISNAIRHKSGEGPVTIEMSGRNLVISNPGQPAALDQQKIFERFYKSGQHGGSTGLGLAIVKKICDLYGYAISYQYREGHHRFQVAFA